MFDQMLQNFARSQQGQAALQALVAQGLSSEQAQQAIAHALPAASTAMQNATAGHANPAVGMFNLFGGHAGREFLTGAVMGLMRGDGVLGSVKDGFAGMLGGHVAEVLGSRMGMDPQMAGQIGAALSPFIAHYAHDHLGNHPAVQQEHGAPPAAAAGGLGALLGGLLGR